MTGIWLAPVFALCAGMAIGQNAELSGLIQDPSNSSVSGAEVSIRNEIRAGRVEKFKTGTVTISRSRPSESRHAAGALAKETNQLTRLSSARTSLKT